MVGEDRKRGLSKGYSQMKHRTSADVEIKQGSLKRNTVAVERGNPWKRKIIRFGEGDPLEANPIRIGEEETP